MPTPPIQIVNVDGTLSKRCPKCKTIKPLTEFTVDRSKNCGYAVQCKPCCKKKFSHYYENNKEHDKARSQEWRALNSEWVKQRSADWRARNQERVKKTQAAHSRSMHGRFVRGQALARSRELEFSLTFEEFKELIEGKTCHYCDKPLNETGLALDRKDSSIGYIATNCVPCCRECNLTKHGSLTYEEMLAVAKLLKEMRNRKE